MRVIGKEKKRLVVDVVMSCDHKGCLDLVRRGPRVVIPSRTPFEVGHKPIRIMTTLHYCEIHAHEFDVQAYLTGEQKTRIEGWAKQFRPLDFKPDFEAAKAEPVLVTTPEYRKFLEHLGVNDAAAA